MYLGMYNGNCVQSYIWYNMLLKLIFISCHGFPVTLELPPCFWKNIETENVSFCSQVLTV